MRNSIIYMTMPLIISLSPLILPVIAHATVLGNAQEWKIVEEERKEIPVEKVYPLKSLCDLKEILFVASDVSFLWRLRPQWEGIFEGYNIQFLDRGTGGLCVNYKEQLDPEWVEFSGDNKILIASCFILHPIHASEDWNFADNYYKRLPQEEKWRDLAGNIIEDPYEGGGAKDIYGNVLRKGDGRRIVMSLGNPYWLNYHLEAAKYDIDAGINAIDMDTMHATPFRQGGDFSEWGVHGFNQYLKDRFTGTELRQKMDINDISLFDIKQYITDGYIQYAEHIIKSDPNIYFFIMPPWLKPIEDPLLREFIKYNYHVLIDFHTKLSLDVKEYSSEKGMVIPYFGNLFIGSPSEILSTSNDSILLSRFADIIQLETALVVPPKERAIITYKIGWAMSERKKPIWSLGGIGDDPFTIGVKQLYLAECYAAGAVPELDVGGYPSEDKKGGLFVTTDGQVYPEIKKYLDFVRDNQQYFKNVEPYSKVGLVYSIPSFMWRTFPMFDIGFLDLRKTFVGYARALEEAQLQYDVLIFGMNDFWDDAETLEALVRYNVLILPRVYAVTDQQLQALGRFLARGGKLICVGSDVFERDEEYGKRDKSQVESLLGSALGNMVQVDSNQAVEFYESVYNVDIDDANWIVQEDLLNRLVAPVLEVCEPLVETTAPYSVGVNLLHRNNLWIIHFLNYDYDASLDSFREKENIGVRLSERIPIERINRVILISPDHDEVLSIENPQGRFFTIPRLRIWSVILMSYPGDFNTDGNVDFDDMAVLASSWKTKTPSDDPNDQNYNPDCDISDSNDGVIDEKDLVIFVDNWLAGTD
jgi:hypothetical protein